MFVGKNLRRSTMAGSALVRSLRLGVSATGLVLAGVALAPAAAQTRDLAGGIVSGVGFGAFTVYTNGTFRDTVAAAGETYSGAMNDSGGVFALTKLGVGALTLTGSGLNTYSGQTLVSNGILRAGAANVLSANSVLRIVSTGSVDLGGFNQSVSALLGTSPLNNSGGAATLTLTNNAGSNLYTGVISGNTRLIKMGAGQQNLSGANSFSGGVDLAGGTLGYGSNLAFGVGAVTVSGAATLSASNGGLAVANDIVLNAGLTSVGAASTLSGVISGTGSLTKNGNATLTLSNSANSFGGDIFLNAGQISFSNGSLGTGTIRTTAQQVSLASAGGSASVGNSIVLGGQVNFELPTAPGTLTLSGPISGVGGLFLKTGSGTLVLAGANSYLGNTLVNTGTLGLQNAASASVGTIRVTGAAVGLAAYANGLTVANNIASSVITGVDTRGFDLTLSGVIANVSAVNIGGLDKTGAGTLTLTGVNTYTNATTVSGGRLNVNGSIVSAVGVANGATLGGTGIIANTVTVANGGAISPGTSPGTLTMANLNLAGGSSLNFELQTPGVIGSGVNDLIIVTNNLDVAGTVTINPIALAGFDSGIYRLINYGTRSGAGAFMLGSPIADFTLTLDEATPGQVNLISMFNGVRFWDGSGPFGNGVVDGGSGVWTAGATNWTNMAGNAAVSWGDTVGVFSGVPGTVTVDGTQTYTNLRFDAAGYTLTGGSITANAGVLDMNNAGTTTINSVIAGTNGVTKTGAGTLVLGGANTFTGAYTSAAGTGVTVVDSDTALGATSASFGAGTTLRTLGNQMLAVPIAIAGGVTLDSNGALLTLNGAITGNSALRVTGIGPAVGQGVVLGAANSYVGATTVQNAVAFVSADNNLGNAGNGVVLDNGALAATETFATARGITLTSNSGIISVAPDRTLTSNGLISGPGGLFKTGAGTLILGPSANTYGGVGLGTLINAGTLQISNAASLGVAPFVVFTGNSTLRLAAPLTLAQNIVINNGFTGTIDTAGNNSTITGFVVNNPLNSAPGGTLTKAGPGQLTLTQANAYSGGTNLTAGTLRIAQTGGIGSGTLTTTGGTTFVAGTALNAAISLAPSNAITLGTGITTIDLVGSSFSINTTSGAVTKNGTTLTINSVISGDGGIATANAGTIVLNGENTYTGGTTLGDGVSGVSVLLGNGNGLGTGAVTMNDFTAVQNNSGSALTATNAFNIAGAVLPAASSIVLGGSSDLTLMGALSGGGGLNKANTGTLTLANAANTYSGTASVNQGALSVTGALTNAAAVVNVRGDASLIGTGTIAGTVNVANAGILSAGIGATQGVLTIGALNLTNTSDVRFDLGAANTVGGPLNDQVAVTGALTLDGRLTVAQSTGGTFGLGIYNLFTYGSVANNTLVIDSTPGTDFTTFIEDNTAQQQINLIVRSTTGPNFLFWDGADTGSSIGIDGNAGGWTAGGFNWTGAAPSALNTRWVDGSTAVFTTTGGTVTLAQGFTAAGLQFQANGYTLTGGGLTIPAVGGTLVTTDPGITATINSPLSGGGVLAKEGTGTLVLGGNNLYTGGTALAAGTLGVASNTALGTGTLAMADGTTLQATSTATLANAVVITGTGNVDTLANTLRLDGIVSGGALTKVGVGTLSLFGVNTYIGGTNLNAGTIQVGTNSALGTGALAMADGTILQSGAAGLSLANAIDITGTGTVDTNGNMLALDGVISGASLTKISAGSLVLTNANTYVGGTSLNAGTIQVANNSALGTGALAMADGTTLQSGAAGLSLANAIDITGTGTVDSNSNMFTLGGVVSGATLTKIGSGTLVLTNANTYVGGTNLNVGTIQVANNNALGTGALAMADGTTLQSGAAGLSLANAIDITGTGTVDTNGNMLTLGGTVSGGMLTKINSGTLVLNGANTYVGGTNLNAGTIQVGTNSALGTGALAMATGTTLQSGAAGLSLANAIGITGTGTVDTNGNMLALGGIISGDTLTKISAGTLVLNGANTFTGGTNLNAGTIQVGTNSALGTGGLAMANGTTLQAGVGGLTTANAIAVTGTGTIDTQGFGYTVTGQISGGAITKTGAGTLTLDNANTYTGGTNLNAGTIVITTNTSLGAGSVAMADGTTLRSGAAGLVVANNFALTGNDTIDTQAFTLTLDGVLSGAGGITKVGSGTLTLTGASTYTGATAVDVGTLNVNGSLANTAVTVASGASLTGTGSIAGAVTILDGGILSPGNSVGTLTVGALTLNNSSILNWEFGAANTIGGAFNDLVIVTGNLVLDGILNVSQSAGGNFTTGIYEIFQYGGALTDNTLSLGGMLPNGQTGFVQTLVPGQVNLVVTQSPSVMLFWDGADGVGNGVISGGSGTWSALSTNWTGAPPSALNTNWQSTIGVFQGAAGTVTIDGPQAFEMLQFAVDGYTLNSGAAGSLTTAGAGVLFASTGANATINAPITGAGSIVKQGGGKITFNGDNSYAGGTALQVGTIAVGNDNALGTGALVMSSNTTLQAAISGITIGNAITTLGNGIVDQGPGVFTLNGTIDGAGSISAIGSGNLVLNGNNLFTNLGINNGRVTVGTNTAAGIGAIAMADNTTLAAGVSGLVLTNFITTAGNGIVDQGTGTFTLNGNIGGAGSISTINTGNLILNGTNTFTNLGVGAGTVTVGTNTAAGIGAISMATNTTLAAGISGLVLANNITTAGNGIVDQGTGTFTLNGNIDGAGSISTVNTGNLILNGNNAFTNLGIGAGTVTVGTNTAAGIGAIAMASNTTLAAGVSGLVLANNITTAGNGIINQGTGTFTLNGVIDGAGSISTVNFGNLILNGNNAFTNLGIGNGTVTVGTNTAAGIGAIALATNTTLAAGTSGLVLANSIQTAGNGIINQGATGSFTLNGQISGPGSISTVNFGNLVLNGNNLFTNLGIGNGTVTVGTNTAAGIGAIALATNTTLAAGANNLTLANSIQTAGIGTIDTAANTMTLTGIISGAGNITKTGSGLLNLTSANIYTGGTVINAGTIGFSTATSMGTGSITVNSGTLLANANNLTLANLITFAGAGAIDTAANALTVSSVISGSGRITKLGTGTLTLTGANTFTGGTTISAGTLVGSVATLGSGGILNNAALVFNQTIDATFNQVISGSGSITKQGAGVLTVASVNTVTGPTNVTAGRLNVTGSLAGSAVTLQSGTSLAGTGSVGALTALSGSTVTPGATAGSVATLTVNGALNLASGSTLAIDINPTGADRVTATGAAITAGNLAVTAAGLPFTTFNQNYTLVSGSSRTGTFATTSLGNYGQAFAPVLVYDATSVILRLAPNSLVTLGGANISGNALAVANSFDAAVRGGYNPQAFFNLYTQGANLPSALNQLSGELHSAERRVLLDDTRVVREAAFDRLNAGLSAIAGSQSVTSESEGKATTFWLRAAGSWGTARADGIGSRFTTEQRGVLTGIDFASNGFKVGGMFHYTNTDVELASLGKSTVESVGGAIYGGYRQEGAGFAIGAGASIASNNANGARAITAPGLAQSLVSDIGGTTYQVFGEVAFDLAAAENTRIEPFARAAYAKVDSKAFAETGGIAGVTGIGQSSDATITTLGMRGAFTTGIATLSGSAGWQRTTGDRNAASILSIPGVNTPFSVASVALDKDAVALEAQASFTLSQKITLGVGYSGVIGDNNTNHGARATLTVGF